MIKETDYSELEHLTVREMKSEIEAQAITVNCIFEMKDLTDLSYILENKIEDLTDHEKAVLEKINNYQSRTCDALNEKNYQ